jgi:hypothetical protein
MRYNITKPTAPKMPGLGKGTECIKLLLSQASKDMHEPLVPMFFPPFGTHISGAEFQYPDAKMTAFFMKLHNNPRILRNTRALLTNNPALLRDKAGLLSYTSQRENIFVIPKL